MLVKDEAFERLKNGESLGQLRTEYRSSSQVAEGGRMYLVWLEQRTEEERAGFAVAREERRKEEAERERVRLEVGALRKEEETLRPEDERLRMDVQRSREELKDLRAGFEEFERRGFNSEILSKLRNVTDKNGSEVWEVLQDHERAQELRQDAAHPATV